MNTNAVTSEQQIARRERWKSAAKEALFWAVVVFLVVFLWKGLLKP